MFDDIYQLKITYLNGNKKQPYRVIEIVKHQNLTNLFEAIIKAYDMYFGHCFGFYDNLRNWTNSSVRYEQFLDLELYYGLEKDTKSPNNSTIESMIKQKKIMLMLYDYGSENHFKVKFIKSVELDNSVKYPRVIESVGK